MAGTVSGKLSRLGRWLASTSLAAVMFCCASAPAAAISLEEAVKVALEANPEIGEAVANREAIEFELKQAKRLYLPQVDLESRYGVQKFDSTTTRPRGQDDKPFQRREANVVVQQLLFNGGERRGEVQRQASRVDGASHRVYERSEFTALNVIREYLEVGLQQRVVGFADDNLAYHRRMLGKIKEGTQAEAISVADRQQAQERVFSAESRLVQAQEDLNSAKIRFFKLVGQPLDHYIEPSSINGYLPPNLSKAIGVARQNSPTIKVATADLDTAYALKKKAKAEYFPEVGIELRGRTGEDLEGVDGHENELRAEVVMRWNIFKGGIDLANDQEQLRRIDEERFGLRKAHRDVEEAVRLSWDRYMKQRQRQIHLRDQLSMSNKLVDAYTEQFDVGDRSLLDLLNTQNTRFNTQVTLETARNALTFAEYRILASVGVLLQVINTPAPDQSDGYARQWVHAPETPEAETQTRISPFRNQP